MHRNLLATTGTTGPEPISSHVAQCYLRSLHSLTFYREREREVGYTLRKTGRFVTGRSQRQPDPVAITMQELTHGSLYNLQRSQQTRQNKNKKNKEKKRVKDDKEEDKEKKNTNIYIYMKRRGRAKNSFESSRLGVPSAASRKLPQFISFPGRK